MVKIIAGRSGGKTLDEIPYLEFGFCADLKSVFCSLKPT